MMGEGGGMDYIMDKGRERTMVRTLFGEEGGQSALVGAI